MKWEFIYYSNRVKRNVLSLPKELLAEYYAMQKIMEDKGPNLGMPYTRTLRDGLFEMRLSDKDGMHVFFTARLRSMKFLSCIVL